jgi:hypothetical protein
VKGRWLELVANVSLLAAAAWVWWTFADLSRHRYFTIDEYQFGHATWLVAQGQRPYLDFYEHHLPLSYVVHAPLVGDPALGFRERALRLRAAVLAHALGLALALGASTWVVWRSREAALLATFLPFACGFSLLSAVDYRADGFAACWALAGFACLDANRRLARPLLAAAAGALLAAACLATQKMAYFAAAPLALLLVADRLRAARMPFVCRPAACLAAVALVFGAALLVGGALGMLPAAFERTILQGLRHEAIYPRVTVGRFLLPFLAATWPTTLPLLALAVLATLVERNRLWLFPLAAALVGGSLLRAQYPYNYVLHGLLLGLLAARGLAGLCERLAAAPRLAALRPLLWLTPLALLPQQLGFAAGRTGNAHQLALLEKIERFSGAGDAVIDGAGAALFRPHGSFYFYHGGAERQLFADYFERELVQDYRRSRALFWLRDLRLARLPEAVQALFREHYVQADGDLFALGFLTPRTLAAHHEVEIEVLRADEYRIFPASPAALEYAAPFEVRIDGERVSRGTLHLAEGRHRLEVGPGAPPLVISPLPPEVFWEPVSAGHVHSPLFEFGVRAGAEVR